MKLQFAFVSASLVALCHVSWGGSLLRSDFESADWSNRSVGTVGAGVSASATYGNHGTIDIPTNVAANGTDVPSKGLLFSVNSSGATGVWNAALRSGVLTLGTANTTITDLGLITLAFSLRASNAHPVIVRLESYDAAGTNRTGGLRTLIYPATPNYYQRFAVDLSTMEADGAGTFVPTATRIVVSFELDSAAGGDGWPSATNHTLRIDNLHYATPAWYVGGAGAANNTTNNRGRTAALPFATINYALERSVPGDIVVVRGGTYNGAVNFRKSVSGSLVCLAGAPDGWITLKNYPGETPVIRHTTWGVINIGLGSSSDIYTGPAAAYLEIRGVTVRGYSTVDAHGDRGIDPAVANPLISKIGTSFGETNCNGIYIEGRRMTNLIHDIRIADSTVEFNTGGGISFHRADRFMVENNITRYNAWWCTYAPSGLSTLVSADFENNADTRIVFQHNQTYGNETHAPWVSDGRFSDGNGLIIDVNRNNEVSSGPDANPDPAYRGRTLVQNNLAVNNGGSGIHAFNAQNVDIIHNTAYLNSGSPRLLYSQIYASYARNARLFGNIQVAPSNPSGDSSRNETVTSNSQFNIAGTIFYQNNLYYGLGTYLIVSSGTNLSPSGNFNPNTVADPQFIAPSRDPANANFRLRAASPARNNAPFIPFRSGRDLSLASRPLVPGTADKGAYQTPSNTVFPPLLSPSPGNYSGAQSISVTSDTADAVFVYTTNGSTPTVSASGNPINGTLYTSPIPVSSATTVRVIGWKSGLAASSVSGGAYTFVDSSNAPLPELLFFPDGQSSTSTRPVGIISRTPGALVRYTTDGSTPSPTNGTLASSSQVSITNQTTLRAIAYLPGRPNSPVKSADYTITGRLGNESAGTALQTLGANTIRFSRFTATSSNTLANVYARVSGAGTYRVALYSDNNGVPGARRATSNAVTNPVAGWVTFTFSSPYAVSSGTNYWLAIWSDNSAAQVYADTTGGTVRQASSTLGGNGAWPTNAPSTTVPANSTYRYAIYATPRNVAPTVAIPVAPNAITLPAAANLQGTVSDEGFPLFPGSTSQQWSKTSGPGTVTFGSPTGVTTTATFSSAGTYVLRLTATDGSLSAFAEASIAVSGTGGGGGDVPEVIYRETFGNAGDTVLAFSHPTIGWNQLSAASAAGAITDASTTNGGADYRGGRPADLVNVNAGNSSSAINGFAQSFLGAQSLVFTTEYPINRSVYTPTSLSWYSHISATNDGRNTQSPAVRIGGLWYVVSPSTTAAGNLTQIGSAGNFNTSGALFTFDFASATATTHNGITTSGWRTLTAVPGAPFAVGANVVELPAAGEIEAYGVYFTTAGSSTARFDSFEISATNAGVVRAQFNGGPGTSSPQQFPGSAGDGWAGGWAQSGAVDAAIAPAPPLQPTTGDFLQVVRTGGTFDQEGVAREWSASTLPDTGFTRLKFDVRIDSDLTRFNTINDNLSISSRTIPGAATSNESSFFIRVFGAATGGLQSREWAVFNGTPGETNAYDLARFVPTGLIVQPGVTYSFTIDLYGAATDGHTGGRIHGTYDVTITDGTTTVRVEGAGFRSAGWNIGRFLNFSTQQSDTADGLTFSLDSIELSALTPLPLPPLAVWKVDNFTRAQLANLALESTLWGDLADPDGDGRANVLEYAFATSPLASDTDGDTGPVLGETVIGNETYLTLSVAKNPAATDIDFTVEASGNLGNWSTGGTVIETNTATTLVVRDAEPIGSPNDRRFLRLRITQ